MIKARFAGGNIEAYDDRGTLELAKNDSEPDMTYWGVKLREPEGKIHIKYTVLHRILDQKTKNGPSFDMRQDNSGLVVSGYGFFVTPVESAEPYEVTLRWDLNNAPRGTLAAWTFGDGPGEIKRKMRAMHIQQCFFMVSQGPKFTLLRTFH